MAIFKGAWPALLTPFTADDQVNFPVLHGVVDYLLAKGVDGFYVCGSTGEGVYMSVDERKKVTEAVVDGMVIEERPHPTELKVLRCPSGCSRSGEPMPQAPRAGIFNPRCTAGRARKPCSTRSTSRKSA